jgi:hypothetical protein
LGRARRPPNADYKSVRAKPLAKPISYPGLTREVELELVRAYREDGDLDALDWLVGAHRPMVVRMAQHRRRPEGFTLRALIEYGMLGVRMAAEPPRPSLTKKGEMVGFDPAAGHRFNTYARHQADKEMRAALVGDPREPTGYDQDTKERLAEADKKAKSEAKAREEMYAWHRAPSLCGTDIESLACPKQRRVNLDFILMKQEDGAYFKPSRPWTLWNPTRPQQKMGPRNFNKHPRTKLELENRYRDKAYPVLWGYEDVAKSRLEGWQGG